MSSRRDLERWVAPGWRERLLAWWEGYDVERMRRVAADARAAESRRRSRERGAATSTVAPVVDPFVAARALEASQLDREGRPVWSVERVRGAERIWGRDLIGPGDIPWSVESVRSFGLSPAKSVLDLTAGLGGRARALVGSYDTWVTGLESSPVLASVAMERSKLAGLAKKAPVTLYDPETLCQPGVFDLVIGDRILHRVRDKAYFLDQLQTCTKEQGALLLYDYVIEGTPRSWDEWNAWRQREPIEVHPWTCRRLSDELVQRNLDVRLAEDLTSQHREQIIARIRALGAELESGGAEDDGMVSGLSRELSVWWHRLRVLGSGLNLFRFVVYKPAG